MFDPKTLYFLRRQIRFFLLGVALLGLVACASRSASPDRGLGPSAVLTFTPTDDATVRESSPGTNYGNRPNLEVDASSRKDALLRFDVTGVGSAAVTRVTLRLFVVDSSPTGGDFVGVSNNAWTEETVTWANAPTGDQGALGSLGRVTSGNWYELDVTNLVTGDGPVSLRVSSTNSNGADYASKEHTNGNAPQLVVDIDNSAPAHLFAISRNSTNYSAVSQTIPSTYFGSLKSVVEGAASELNGLGGGTISFGSGEFDLELDWLELNDLADIIFEGQGINATTLRNSSNAAQDTEPFNFTGSDRITIRDMTVEAGGSARETSDALDFDGGDDNLVERIRITAARGRGIIFDGKDDPALTGGTADRNVVRDCEISGTLFDAIQLLAADNNRIENCVITNVGGDGVRVHKASASAFQAHKGSNDNTIIGNTVDNVGTVGIRVHSGNRNLITDNTVTNSSDDVAGQDGIRIASGEGFACDDNVVEANSASDNQTPKTQAFGLNIVSAECNRTVVQGNAFSGNAVGAINDNGTGTLYPGAGSLHFDVSRSGSTYSAVSRTTPATYTGTLKSVVESALEDLKLAGGTVTFGTGDFDLGSDHLEIDGVNDVVFEGQGMGITTIRNFTNEASDTEPFDAVRSDRLTVRDMTVSAGGSDRTTSDALDFDGGDDILIERVEVTDSRGRGIVFDGKDAPHITGGTAERNVIRDCVITNVPRDGIQLLAANHNTVENCHISNTGREGIRLHKSGSSTAQPNKPSNDNLITGNTIENAAGNGVSVTGGDRNVITGNTISNNGDDGVYIFTSTSALNCDDNEVDGNTASGNRYGLNINNSSCHRTVVGNNNFSGNSVAPIRDNGTDTVYTSGDTEPPSAPGSLVASSVQASQVTLGWNAATDNVGVTGYNIYRNGSQVASVGVTTSYQDVTVAPDTSYQYEVRARDAAGNLSNPSNSINVTTPPGSPVLTFIPTDDATVRESRPTTNYGSSQVLEVDASSRKDALLRFDITGVGSSTVSSATLHLFVVDRSPSGGDFAIVTNTTWRESITTWQNAPAGDGGSLGSLGEVKVGTWYELDVTNLVIGDGPVSLRVSSTNSNGADYASKEHTNGNAPQLVVTVTTP